MEKQWFVAPSPRTSRTLYTIVGSVLLHGSVIAVAALWPVRYAPPAPPPLVTDFVPAPPGDPIQLPPSSPDVNTTTPDDDAASDAPGRYVHQYPAPLRGAGHDNPTPPKPPSKTVVSRTRPLHAGGGWSARSAGHGKHRRAECHRRRDRHGPPRRGGPMEHAAAAISVRVRAARVQGNGSVRITTDGSGHVVSVSVVRSTGNAVLDANTSQFARSNWSGPPNATVTVPITYQMR